MTVTIGPDSVLRHAIQTRVRRFRGKMFIAAGEEAYELDELAQFIFGLVDGEKTVTEIGTRISRDYDVPVDEATADVAELLTPFAKAGMLEVVR
jgi:pyrroloquinoline quinone biosynthesis protein D